MRLQGGQAGESYGEQLGSSGLYGWCNDSLQRATSSGLPQAGLLAGKTTDPVLWE